MDPLILACALFSFGFAIFHVLFWRIFDWPKELEKLNFANRAIMQILNLRLIYVFIAVGVICLAYPLEMRTTPVGRALLIGMSCFWAGRLCEQFLFLRHKQKSMFVLSGVLVLGTVLFLLPVFL